MILQVFSKSRSIFVKRHWFFHQNCDFEFWVREKEPTNTHTRINGLVGWGRGGRGCLEGVGGGGREVVVVVGRGGGSGRSGEKGE